MFLSDIPNEELAERIKPLGSEDLEKILYCMSDDQFRYILTRELINIGVPVELAAVGYIDRIECIKLLLDRLAQDN